MIRNRYRVVGRLGAGAMGTVYAVDDLFGGARVALKALWPEAGDGELVASLRDEFGVLAALRDPLLCRVHDFGRLPPGVDLPDAPPRAGYFYTRELVAGIDLGAAAADADRRVATLCRWLAWAARGLDVLHRAGLRHGDFKPKNAIVGDDIERPVRLIDFGLAAGETSSRSAGTIAYMAPEILAHRAVDRRADLYALGIALFEVVAGELPSAAGPETIIAWHLARERPSLRARRPDCPPALDDVASRLIAFDPDDRLPSAAEAAAALDAIAAAADAPRGRRARPREAAAPPPAAPLFLRPVGQAHVASLERAFERRRAGQGGAPMIELAGAVGCGKTTILTELAWRAQLAGAEVLRAHPEARGHALGALGSVLAQLDALRGSGGDAAREIDDPQRGPGHVALAIATALADAARAFPILVLLDDLDFADEGSRALAPAVALALPARAPVLLVASRTAAAPDSESSTARDVATLFVHPLTAAEIDDIVQRVAGRPDRRLTAWVHQHTGGNLLHLVHTMRELAARGFPVVEKLAALALPPRLEEWERAELAAIPPDERAAVEALAVLGAPALPPLVASVAGAAELPDPHATLERAARRGLLRQDADDRYRPARPATAQSLHAALDPARRVALHRRAATALAAAGEDTAAVLWHQVRGGQVDAVLPATAPALRRLRTAGDHAGALALGAAVLDLAAGAVAGAAAADGLLQALRLEVGELATLCGDLARADAVIAPLLDAGDPALQARARLALARACDAGGETDRAERLFRSVLDVAPPTSDAAVWAARDLAAHYIRRGRTTDALDVAEAALAHDVPAATRGHLVAARAFARGASGSGGSDAIAELEDVARAAEQAGDRALYAAALHFAARLAFSGGDYRRAQSAYEASLAAAEATGEVARIATLRMNLAAMAFSFGEFGRSLEHYGTALSLFRATGLRTSELLARRNLGHLLIELGEIEQARGHLDTVARDAARAGLMVQEIGAEALLGIADWRTGDLESGRRRLASARQRFAALGDVRRESETLLDLADLELAAADDDGARLDAAATCLAAAGAIPATREDTARRARHAALAAHLAARLGDRAGAAAHLVDLDTAMADVVAQGGRQLEWELHRIAAAAAEHLEDAAAVARHRGRALALLDRIAAGLPDAQRLSFWHDPRRRDLRRTRGPSHAALEVGSTILGQSSARDRMVDKLFQLLEVYRRLSTERDAARLLELAMDTAVELSGCERGFLLLARPGRSNVVVGRDDQPGLVGLPGGGLETAVARNLPPATLAGMAAAERGPLPDHASVPYSRSIAERVFLTGEAVLTTDAQLDPRFDRAASVHALHIGRVLCIPIHAHGRAAGVLYLEAKGAARPIGEDEVRLLRAFGDQVAVLLDSARLLAENARRADELEVARREIEQLLAERTELLEQRTEELASARRDLESVHRRFLGGRGAFGLVGRSPAMERVFEVIDRAAATDVPVLVLGESGTGKELVARALHQYGRRRSAPLVALNCGALPEGLLESELFGHVRGAFTGADRNRRGLFEAADGGTLFLDEIGDTPLRMQATLLRAVQEGVVRPVGGMRDVVVDVRLVAATHRPLEELVEEGRFRQDLYYRLHVLSIEVPPLRERREDIPLLAEHFLAAIAERTGLPRHGLTRRAMRALSEHAWPGNVRQLEHALTQATVMTSGKVIDVDDLGGALRGGGAGRAARSGRPADDRRARERQKIIDALEANEWNRSKAAEALGMPRRTFYRRLAEHDIQ